MVSPFEVPQLALQMSLDDENTWDNFYARGALEALLKAVQSPNAEPLSFLHGPAGSGKTHVLQALCHATEGAVYLPLGELKEMPADALLADLEQSALIALDELESIAAEAAWEEGLFHLINRARQAGSPVWCAASKTPLELGIALRDLSSRLAGGVVWAMPACNDEDLRAVLHHRGQQRGLKLEDAVIAYISSRERRSLDQLLSSLEKLDQASLQLKRPITVPLVREVMGW
ncbi:MAG: DnaA regulatory inactivator Hda [Pseudomonadota bacterium]